MYKEFCKQLYRKTVGSPAVLSDLSKEIFLAFLERLLFAITVEGGPRK
jgi:hypothetical protein